MLGDYPTILFCEGVETVDRLLRKSSSRSTLGSIQVSDHDDALMNVGENREHLSLLSSSRQHAVNRSIRFTSPAAGSLAPTSSQDGSTHAASSSLSVSLPVSRRMINYYRLIFNRHPRGKGVLLVFTLYFLESFAFNGALTGAKSLLSTKSSNNNLNGTLATSNDKDPLSQFVYTLLYSSAGRVFYPVAGVIADSYIGRYRMIHIGLWILWIGFAIGSMSLAFLRSRNWGYTVAVIAFVLFSAGSGSVEATLIPFGVDQLSQGASSDELSSYFYYLYLVRNAGGMVSILTLFIFSDKIDHVYYSQSDINNSETISTLNTNIQYIVQSVLALVAVSTALAVLICMKGKFYHDRHHSNALKLIYKVLSFAATVKRRIPRHNRAFRYGEGRKPRIELAKREYDGIFSSEEVEDVKTCYRMLFLIFALFGYFVTYSAGFAYISSELGSAATKINHHNLHYLTTNVVWTINTGAILIALPLINHVIIPFWPTVNMRLKVGVGFMLHILSFGVAGFVQWKASVLTDEQFFSWMVLPTILLSVAEAVVFVSSLEFIYAQSPNNMKGLQTGMFYLIYGIFSAIGSTLYFGVTFHNHSRDLMPELCLILVVIGVVGFLVYVLTSCHYKNRQRPTIDGSEYDTQRRLMYEDVMFS